MFGIEEKFEKKIRNMDYVLYKTEEKIYILEKRI